MGRPRKFSERRITTAVRLPEWLHRDLSRVAEERDTSINHLMVKGAEFYLKHLPSLSANSVVAPEPPACGEVV